MNPFPEGSYLGMNNRDFFIRVVGWALVIVCCTLVWLLMRSPWGRVLKGIREDENAVRSLGKNVYSYKMQALIIGGVLGALAGMVFTLPRGAVQPANYGTELTFFLYTCLLLGGLGTVLGPVIGAMIFWVVLSLTQGILYGADRIRRRHLAEHRPGRAAALHPGRRRADAADDFQAPGRLRQQEGAGVRMSTHQRRTAHAAGRTKPSTT